MRILIAIPALNEETILRDTIATLRAFCADHLCDDDVLFVIADNGSTDGTEDIGRGLADAHADVRHLRLAERGKGRAIRAAWSSSEADAYVFMDADLSTDLRALPALVRRVAEGTDVAAGSRFHPDSVVERGVGRRIFSAGYRLLLRVAFGTKIDDAPCGFKAVSPRVVREVLPTVENEAWFFDTELLLRAERAGNVVVPVPVQWTDRSAPGRRSKVKVLSLTAAYLRHVVALYRRIGPVARERALGIRELVHGVTKRERAVVFGAVVAALLLVGAPVVKALLHGGAWDMQWSGRSVFAPGDTTIYLNQIAQARDGVFFFQDQATTEPIAPLANPFWYVLGLFAKLTRLSPLATYTLARFALIPVFALVAYGAVAVFVKGSTARVVAFLTFFFGGGVGMFAEPFMGNAVAAGTLLRPIDTWVSEALPFASMSYSPHFIASWTLLLATFALLHAAFRSGRVRHAVGAGAAFFALTSFHPFYAPVVVAVGATFLFVDMFASGFRGRSWMLFMLACGIAAPAIAYHAWAFFATTNGVPYGAQNVLLTPPFAYVVLGFGMPLLGAAWAAVAAVRKGASSEERFLVIWAVVTLLLAYGPFSFQRRLLEGAFFPISVLAAGTFVALWRAVASSRISAMFLPAIATVAAMTLFSSTASVVIRHLHAYGTFGGYFYSYEDESAGFEWVRETTPKDARFLGAFSTGNDLLGFGERPVYAGHWALTIDPQRKMGEVARYFGTMTGEQKKEFVRTNDIDYVWYGHDERAAWPSFVPDDGLEEAFLFGNVAVYRVRR